MGVGREMPQFRSHKLVWALRIAAIEIHEDRSATIAPKDDGYASFKTRAGWADRFTGTDEDLGVFVQYDDGFTSWSPSEAFDNGYTPYSKPTPGVPCPRGEAAIEAEIQSKGLNAPRLNPQMINDTIVATAYHVFPETTLTVCCLTLRNGFTVTGESAAASPLNFDEEIGRKIARDNARNKIWQLEGYLLRQRLADMAAQVSDGATEFTSGQHANPYRP